MKKPLTIITVIIMAMLPLSSVYAADPGGAYQSGNFWDKIVDGVLGIVGKIIPIFPSHEAMNIATTVAGAAKLAIKVIYEYTLVNFDMTIPVMLFGIVLLLETARIAYAAWMLIKKAILVIG